MSPGRGARTDLACRQCGKLQRGLYVWSERTSATRAVPLHVGSMCTSCGAHSLPAPLATADACHHADEQVILERGARPERSWSTIGARCRTCLTVLRLSRAPTEPAARGAARRRPAR